MSTAKDPCGCGGRKNRYLTLLIEMLERAEERKREEEKTKAGEETVEEPLRQS